MEHARSRPAKGRPAPRPRAAPPRWLARRGVRWALVLGALAALGVAAGGLALHHPLQLIAGAGLFAVIGGALGLSLLGWKRTLVWAGLSFLALVAVVAAAAAITLYVYSNDPRMPSVESLRNYHPKQVTRIVARGSHGDELLGEIYTERRTVVAYDDVPPLLVDAFVVAEDANFWEHGGIDYKGMIRAFFANLVSGHAKQGASTITQQVVKNLLLTPQKTFRRKMQEIILARRLEGALTKKQIMALYLNQIYFGQGRYGVVEAARYYFHKELADLSPGEMAYLAGLPQAPEAISSSAQRGGARLQYVLNQLLAHGKIDLATAEKYKDMPVPPYDDAPTEPIAPEVVDLVRADLEAKYGKAALDTLGGEVRVTVRPELQALARAALQKRLRSYDERYKLGVPIRKVAAGKLDAEIARLGKKLPGSGPKAGKTYPAVVTAVSDADQALTIDLGDGPVAMSVAGDRERRNPDRKKASERFAPGDVIEVVWGDPPRFPVGPEGAVVIIDVKTRDVLALVGGFHVRPGEFDRAVQAHRQAGSTFKPFLYAAAIGEEKYTAASIVNDAPDVIGSYKPKDYDSSFKGAVRLRYALAESINTVAVRICYELGPAAVAAMAHAMGIESDLPDGADDWSVALGSGEVTPLELTNAFATFAAGGRAQPPRIVQAVNGELVDGGRATQALSPQVSYVLLDMMRSVLEPGGTGGGAAKALKVPAVGKTGTSNDERDAWFVGLTPDYAVGVWVGYDDNRPLGAKQTGGAVSLPVFVEIINKIGSKGRRFDRPSGVVVATIDKATGLLAAEGAPPDTTLDEVFLDGTAPTEVAPLPGEVDTTTFVTDEYGDADSPDTQKPEGDDAAPVAHP